MQSKPSLAVRLARIVVALILLQTLFFKFTGAPESVWIFSQLGAEPWGRIGSGVVELVAAVLLLAPGALAGIAGAGIAGGTIVGAILSHLFVLGIDIQGDGGLLFGLACAVFVGSAWILWHHRATIRAFLLARRAGGSLR